MSVLRSASLRYADAGLNADDRCKIIAGTGMRKRRNTGVFPWRHLFITLVISHCDVSANILILFGFCMTSLCSDGGCSLRGFFLQYRYSEIYLTRGKTGSLFEFLVGACPL